MAKTKIEWCDYTINPVKGLCPVGCSYCYARRMYKRFKWDETIRFDQTVFNSLPPSPGKVFVGSTMELFGEWVKFEWMNTILSLCGQHTEKTFIFLTKQPQNLIKFSPFPDNCWVGVSVWNEFSYLEGMSYLEKVEAKVKFMSFEPLLENIYALPHIGRLQWLIIGQQTPASPRTSPKIEWIKEIVDAADQAGVPVFLKDNLKPLLQQNTYNIYSFPEWAGKQIAVTGDHSLGINPHPNDPMRILRQEFPKVEAVK